jgi:NAD-dependent DNA ligase
VIPNIIEVIESSITGKPDMPSDKYKWNETNVDVIVEDIDNLNVKTKKMVHFFKQMNIKNADEKTIQKIVDNGITSIIKMLQTPIDDFIEINGIGKRLITKIIDDTVTKIKQNKIESLMSASQCFGRGIGKKTMAKIVKECPEIINIIKKRKYSTKQLKEDMMNIHGIDVKTAEKISTGMKKFIAFFYEINAMITIKHLLNVVNNNGNNNNGYIDDNGNKLFVGQKIVFTGVRNKQLEEFIETNGGVVSTSVSSQSTLLIHSDDTNTNSSKVIRAKQLNIPLISISEFKNKYKLQLK